MYIVHTHVYLLVTMTFDVLHVQIGKTCEYLIRTARAAYSVYILHQVSGICYFFYLSFTLFPRIDLIVDITRKVLQTFRLSASLKF